MNHNYRNDQRVATLLLWLLVLAVVIGGTLLVAGQWGMV